MKIKELIYQLQEIEKKEGDINIEIANETGDPYEKKATKFVRKAEVWTNTKGEKFVFIQ